MGPHPSRIKRTQLLLVKQEIDAIIVVSTANFFYFTGIWIDPLERLLACVIRKNGDPVIIAPQIHEEELAPCSIGTILWQDGQDPIALLARCLPVEGIVAVDNLWPSRYLLFLMKQRPKLAFTNSDEILGVIRRKKDSIELGYLREAGAKTDRIMQEITRKITAGVKEIEVAEELLSLWRREGEQPSFPPIY
ncbi:Creatinase/Aminopeptidase P, N-terminal [Acididesulfobacillus acetoxydans]|uniref:Creatinase/Aminopeptidase P, N-terminal n=1 Tax=Acididesulfobacillus acetoxydans TaxID=1561005 RepID=A0A8S0WX97_9FIRM|nr:aminopeptidase P family N-terminal domain-containing protein [Acididesulfobacillus acetoxydans]CAA7600831.1 Creatinase/Aminopeptidase P, N-terminal [Acididesulfobacillus acetoxydans]CEJ09252.1 Peptidase M24 [Acididesulfobacillus acetoxydans]